MIQYLKRNEIDIEKYNSCIENSINSRIYAFSWYLDIVADNWDALVLNDYEAVMPLPWRQKFFIKYIYPPLWTQQLGVFSLNSISEGLIIKFIKAIPRKFKKITIQFNSENKFKNKNIIARANYILPLNKSYEEIYKGYRKDRRKRLRQISGLKFSSVIEFRDIKKSFIEHYSEKIVYSEKDYTKLELLIKSNYKENRAELWGVYDDNLNLLSSLVTLKYNKRIVVLFSSTSNNGYLKNAFSYLIDRVICNYENSNYKIDFEGSNIKSIASFNKSFGALKEDYFYFRTYKV